jgi:16S rRNA A1518/A1519 N6-dimethyltransferase RsmA/KsgA/DIM1 with predicted DNA glycosylase/AP lyase activity
LTKKLIAIVDKPLVLLEKDETLVPHLQQFLNNPENKKIDLIMGDALALDTASLLEQK